MKKIILMTPTLSLHTAANCQSEIKSSAQIKFGGYRLTGLSMRNISSFVATKRRVGLTVVEQSVKDSPDV